MKTIDGHELFYVEFSWGSYAECSCGYFRPEDEADWDQHLRDAGVHREVEVGDRG